jgi:hypothetical protein
MKIVQEGSFWWLEVKHTCKHCDTVYMLDSYDRVVHSAVYKVTVRSECPKCGEQVYTEKPWRST